MMMIGEESKITEAWRKVLNKFEATAESGRCVELQGGVLSELLNGGCVAT